MLALGIRYLNGFSAASDPDNYERAEWPPHPGRVFMAMAAAHFQTGADSGEREALEWLENLDQAPVINAPQEIQRAVVTHYVPVNDKSGPSTAVMQSIPIGRSRQPRTFARAWLDSDTVWLAWPGAEPEEKIREALSGLCSKVTRIGHSTSLVQMWVPDAGEIGEPNWIPDDDRATIRLRIATPGTLEELERRYNGEAVETYASLKATAEEGTDKKAQKAAKERLKNEFHNEEPVQLRPQVSMTHGYARPSISREAEVPGSVFDPHLRVLRLIPEQTPYRYLDLACVPMVVQRWREALLSRTNGLPQSVREVLSGHDADGGPSDKPHLAFVPLAYAGSEHADGHLLGMGLALPKGLSREDRRGVVKVIGEVGELKLGRLGTWKIEVETRERPPWNLRSETWTAHPKGHTHWSTVTPVVYDRHPKASDRAAYLSEVAEMVRQACLRIGLLEPREVITTPVSAHLGAPPAHVFPRLQRKDGSLRRHLHVILVFDQPVCGPVLIGAGRYRGYGVCRAMEGGGLQGALTNA